MKVKLSAFVFCLMICGVSLAQEALNNDSVIKMVKASLADSVIISMIQSQPGNYVTSPDSMISLKNNGVWDQVLTAMTTKMAGGSAAPMPPTASSSPFEDLDIGVYLKVKGDWAPVPSERVDWKTGGIAKSIFSDGIVKPDRNGHIVGPNSATKVTSPVVFMIKVPEGAEATDYQLVHLHSKSDAREFRTMTGGVFHSSGGATRDNVNFEQQKIGKRCYEISLPTGTAPGDYAFLAPGITGSTASGSTGKAYTFHFIE